MRALLAEVHQRLRPRSAQRALLQVGGFSCLSFAAGMWLLPVGIAVAGVSLLVMAWLQE